MSSFMNRPWLILGAGALLVGGVVLGQSFRPGTSVLGSLMPVKLKTAGLSTGVDMSTLKQLDQTFSALSEAASQGVVFITSETDDKASNDPMAQLQGSKSGSGFVYRSDGWIVTNDHVVAGNDKVKVVLADGRELIGKVTHANDPQLDLAVVKVDQRDLPTLALANSGQVRVGQLALAIGAPFGLEDTVTIGHVSAVGRLGQIPDPSTGQVRVYSGLIQTDASINPGNSGGPLINVDGDVIGVNSAINSTNGSNAGIGFAIPSNVVKAVADKLIDTGKFDRGMLGVNPRDLKPFEKKDWHMDGGAYALSVEPGSPAYKAGLRDKDVITQIDKNPVTNEIDLRIAMYRHSPNETVNVTYVHDGQTKTASVKLAAPPKETQQTSPRGQVNPFGDVQPFFNQPDQAPNDQPKSPHSGKPRLGVMVQQLDGTLKKQFGIPAGVNGVVVTSVNDGSFASKVNMQVGDVLTEVNGKKISDVQDVMDSMSGVNWGDQVTVKFDRFRNGNSSAYTVTVPFE